MRKALLAGLLSLHICGAAVAGKDKIQDFIENGLVTKEALERLTEKDVPAKWKVTRQVKADQRRMLHTFSRGTSRVLEVSWRQDWVEAKQRMFVAAIYDGDTRIARIMYIKDATSVVIKDVPQGYTIMPSLNDNGTFSLKLMHQEKGFVEEIVISGRDTRPIDDLEFTKVALGMDQIISPLLEIVREQAEKRRKQSAEPGNE